MSNWMPKAGWIVSGICTFGLLASAAGKLSHAAPLVENFGKFGFKEELLTPIGIMEALIAVLFIVPRTAFVGAILTTGYLGGAVCTHLRVSDAIFAPLILGILCWVGYGLRNPQLMREALGLSPA